MLDEIRLPNGEQCICFSFFFFNDTATTEIYTLSLHDALPIFLALGTQGQRQVGKHSHITLRARHRSRHGIDRKSTRLNSSHTVISYAVFCLKKKKQCYSSETRMISGGVRHPP